MAQRLAARRWLSGVVGAPPQAPAAAESFLGPTRYIDSEHPSIVSKARELTAGATSAREQAVRIHDFVRDEVRFGFEPAFYDMKASEVLAARRGFCTPKTTLLVALLRAAGIAARMRMVDLSVRVLEGLLPPEVGPYVDHGYAELLLEGRWLRLDSYVLDRALYARARERLAREGKQVGYGIHAHGSVEWDGTSEVFVQYVNDGTVPGYVGQERGVQQDVGTFYRDTPQAHSRLTLPLRLLFPLVVGRVNARIESVRWP